VRAEDPQPHGLAVHPRQQGPELKPLPHLHLPRVHREARGVVGVEAVGPRGELVAALAVALGDLAQLGLALVQAGQPGGHVGGEARAALEVDLDEAVVHPRPGHGAVVHGLALGDLVLVVGKLQVHPAAVQVKPVAQNRVAHGRALDVPPGPPVAPGGGPAGAFGLVGLGALPQGEVALVALAVAHLAAAKLRAPGGHVALRQLAVVREAGGVVVHVALVGDVREALREQGLDVGDDVRQVLAHPRLGGGRAAPEGGGVFAVRGDEALGHGARVVAGGVGHGDDLVVDVGVVAYVLHAPALGLEVPHEHVEDHGGPGVADVDVPVHRRAADVEAGRVGGAGGQRDGGVGEAVVQSEGHGRSGGGTPPTPPAASAAAA
jgi:hypothetical protein